MPAAAHRIRAGARGGLTLVELMIAVAIVGVLAAVALPVLTGHIRDARLSEATSNIQGILTAQEAYFARFDRYTSELSWCPPAVPGKDPVVWPANVQAVCDGAPQSGAGWVLLGWTPDAAVLFRYRVVSSYPDPANTALMQAPGPGVLNDPNTWAVDWGNEGFGGGDFVANPRPWCVVEAEGDTDAADGSVFFRGNSYNRKIFRTPDNEW